MEPLDEESLSRLLRGWQAPDAPSDLERKIFGRPRPRPWWRWLLTGSIRVPVPAGIAAVAILLALAFSAYSRHDSPQAVTLSDFQPVDQLQPRIVGGPDESR